MFDELFAKKKLSHERLLKYGFTQTGTNYHYDCDIMDGDFRLHILFDSSGNVDTSLTECDTQEEYSLYKTTAQGSFLGKVRGAIETVLRKISDQCFVPSPFRQTQTLQVLEYIRKTYGDEPEFLWKATPHNAILRRKDTEKWYCAILAVPQNKLGLPSEKPIEIIDLRACPKTIANLLMQPHFYPGWHMNKKSWYTVILDGSIENEMLFSLLDESYRLAKK